MNQPRADGLLARWARRKAQVRRGEADEAEPAAPPVLAVAPVAPASDVPLAPTEPVREPAPTMADVTLLSRDSDYTRFVAAGVDEGVKRAAMKKLFTDPHFNVMDGLDTYIADYGKPDPIPIAMLRQMNQSKFLRLFDDDDEEEATGTKNADPQTETALTDPPSPPDDHADLRLQQDDAAGRPSPEQGAGA